MRAQAEVTPAAVVDEAIARVLNAEQSARGAVQAFVAEAEAIRAQARTRARLIAERAAERAARVHRRTDAAIGLRLELLERERQALTQASVIDPDEPGRLDRALDRLARDLVEGIE